MLQNSTKNLIVYALFSTSLAGLLPAQDSHPNRPSEDRMHRFESQTVVVPDIAAEGYILDLGGGGEGIIGQLKPKQAIAIDINKRELQEAPPGPLKIVMDATDLKFLDGSFRTVTCFFTLMYMKPADQEKAFGEAFRVLMPGGRFLVWDVILPLRIEPDKDIAVFPMMIKLPDRDVKTGYGTFFPEKAHDSAYFVKIAQAAGFKVAKSGESGRTFHLEPLK